MTKNADPIQVGQRIKDTRLSLGLTTVEFGQRIDGIVKSGTVANWETGKNLPNKRRLKVIAELGGITVAELLCGKSVDPVLALLEAEISRLSPTDDYSQGLIDGLKRAKALVEKKEELLFMKTLKDLSETSPEEDFKNL